MFVETSRSAQPRPAPLVPVAGLLTPTPADQVVEQDPDAGAGPEPPRTGVVRHDRSTATSTFRLRNGAEVTLGGSIGGSRGVWSSAFEGHRRRRHER